MRVANGDWAGGAGECHSRHRDVLKHWLNEDLVLVDSAIRH